MILRGYLFTLLLLFFTSVIFSQQKQFQKGNIAFDNLAYAEAIKLYEDAYDKGCEMKGLYERLADSYYYNSNLEKAVYWYKKLIVSFQGQIQSEHIDRYANCLISIREYKEANKVKKHLGSSTTKDISLGYLDTLEGLSGRFELDTLKINSMYSDYAPSFYKEKLVFTSSRNIGTNTTFIHEWNNEPFLDLYMVTNVSVDSVRKSTNRLKGNINTKFHESSTTFSKDFKTVYFTRSNFLDSKVKTNGQGHVLLKLYKATFDGKKWKNIEELPFNSDEYSVSHPALSPDGKLLYFASDKPGGYGQSDLYVVRINEQGGFGTPRNLGNRINTKGKETFPYISNTGRLFFASNGHKGLGSLDIFTAWSNENGEMTIENLGEPINSPKDDFTFIIDEDKNLGYFASNRKGGKGSDDIYGFKQLISFPVHYPSFKVKSTLERHVQLQEDILLGPEPIITSN